MFLSNNGTVLNSLNKFTGFDALVLLNSRELVPEYRYNSASSPDGQCIWRSYCEIYSVYYVEIPVMEGTSRSSYAITQDELNKLHEGPPFRFAENYAQLMSTLYGCMTFNLGIPLLNWIGFVNCLLFYFIDKYFFVHVCSSPARIFV